VARLKHHNVVEAWAGSFEGLLHRNLLDVNARLAEECRKNGGGILVPFGSVNPAWPDWEEDLRLCHEVHRMPGIRLHPGYQTYTFAHPEFARLIRAAADRGLLIQISGAIEDPRTQHPNLFSAGLNGGPLVEVLRGVPHARVQFLNTFREIRGAVVGALTQGNVLWDISTLESNGAVGRVIDGNMLMNNGVFDRVNDGSLVPVAGSPKIPYGQLAFGSLAPYFPVQNSILKLFESPMTKTQFVAIACENARRFLRPI
jgi:predicted TIM-barrel fold metal-dependent hydrolase